MLISLPISVMIMWSFFLNVDLIEAHPPLTFSSAKINQENVFPCLMLCMSLKFLFKTVI